jgi:hypothetical protein
MKVMFAWAIELKSSWNHGSLEDEPQVFRENFHGSMGIGAKFSTNHGSQLKLP